METLDLAESRCHMTTLRLGSIGTPSLSLACAGWMFVPREHCVLRLGVMQVFYGSAATSSSAVTHACDSGNRTERPHCRCASTTCVCGIVGAKPQKHPLQKESETASRSLLDCSGCVAPAAPAALGRCSPICLSLSDVSRVFLCLRPAAQTGAAQEETPAAPLSCVHLPVLSAGPQGA